MPTKKETLANAIANALTGTTDEPEISAKVVASGEKIIIPETMTLKQARNAIDRQMQREEEEFNVYSVIEGVMLDAAYCFNLALKEIFGWTSLVPTPGFFGSQPPTMVTFKTGHRKEDFVQVPWGRIELPGIEGYLQTGLDKGNFVIGGLVRRKHEKTIDRIIELTKQFMKESSVLRGKAFTATYEEKTDPRTGETWTIMEPQFIDMSKIKEDELVFTGVLAQSIQTNLFTPVEKTEECRRMGIPLKRGVLLTGPYGTGKTLAANVTAKKATQNGWTFLYCQNADQLKDTLKVAQQYQPACVFCEDLDRVTSGERDMALDDILNIIDGTESKSAEIMTVLTTNDVESIHSAMLRPGRLDAVIDVCPPDAEGVERLIRNYGRGLVKETETLKRVGKELAGRIPAVIREVVERAKLDAIALSPPGSLVENISEDALMASAQTMNTQLRLLDRAPFKELSEREKAATILAQGSGAVAEAIKHAVNVAYSDDYSETPMVPDSVTDMAEMAGLHESIPYGA